MANTFSYYTGYGYNQEIPSYTFTAPESNYYKFFAWGKSGDGGSGAYGFTSGYTYYGNGGGGGGAGGFAASEVYLSKGEHITLVIGTGYTQVGGSGQKVNMRANAGGTGNAGNAPYGTSGKGGAGGAASGGNIVNLTGSAGGDGGKGGSTAELTAVGQPGVAGGNSGMLGGDGRDYGYNTGGGGGGGGGGGARVPGSAWCSYVASNMSSYRAGNQYGSYDNPPGITGSETLPDALPHVVLGPGVKMYGGGGGSGGATTHNSNNSALTTSPGGTGTPGVVVIEKADNRPPTPPSGVSVPNPIQAGQNFTVSWPTAYDVDNNLAKYIVQRATNGSASFSQVYTGAAISFTDHLPLGAATSARYAVKAVDAEGLESDWAYSAWITVQNNRPPISPGAIVYKAQAKTGNPMPLSCGAASDPDGDALQYVWEHHVDNGVYTQVGVTNACEITATVPSHGTLYQVRVKAVDGRGGESTYMTGAAIPISYNDAPVITDDTEGDMGDLTDAGIACRYTVTDDKASPAAVQISIDGIVFQTVTVPIGVEQTFTLAGEPWMRVLNGNHILRVTATDAMNESTVREVRFSRNEGVLEFKLKQPRATVDRPRRIVLNLRMVRPEDSILTVLACNNAGDETPTWENVTASVIAGHAFLFENKTKVAPDWEIDIHFTLERSGAQGDCYLYGFSLGYDTDGDSKVDRAETAGRADSVEWTSVTERPDALPNPSALTLQLNGEVATTYGGESAETLNITADAIGAATVAGVDEAIAQVREGLNHTENKLTYPAACTYDSTENAYQLELQNVPAASQSTLPDGLPPVFPVVAKMPEDYVEGAVFRIGEMNFEPKYAGFKAEDVVSILFDREAGACFVGGGDAYTKDESDILLKNKPDISVLSIPQRFVAINSDTGDDANDGASAATPMKTISGAFAKYPYGNLLLILYGEQPHIITSTIKIVNRKISVMYGKIKASGITCFSLIEGSFNMVSAVVNLTAATFIETMGMCAISLGAYHGVSFYADGAQPSYIVYVFNSDPNVNVPSAFLSLNLCRCLLCGQSGGLNILNTAAYNVGLHPVIVRNVQLTKDAKAFWFNGADTAFVALAGATGLINW